MLDHLGAEKIRAPAAWGALQPISKLADPGVVTPDTVCGAALTLTGVVALSTFAESSGAPGEPPAKLRHGLSRKARFAKPSILDG